MRFSIGAKLGLGFFLMMLLVAATGLASIITISRLSAVLDILAWESEDVLYVADIWDRLLKADAALERAVVIGTDGELAIARYQQSELKIVTQTYLDRTKNIPSQLHTSPKVAIASFKTAQHDYDWMCEMYIKIGTARTIDLQSFSDNKDKALSAYLFALAEMEQESNERMQQALDEIQQAQSSLLLIMIIFTVIAAILGSGLAIGITRSITVPVRQIVEVADKISMGDLETSIPHTSKDEIGDLQESIERMRISLKTVIEMLRKK